MQEHAVKPHNQRFTAPSKFPSQHVCRAAITAHIEMHNGGKYTGTDIPRMFSGLFSDLCALPEDEMMKRYCVAYESLNASNELAESATPDCVGEYSINPKATKQLVA